MLAHIPPRALAQSLIVLTAFISLVFLIDLNQTSNLRFSLPSLEPARQTPGLAAAGGNHILPVPSRTYVVHLPRRTDRRREMEVLRTRLGVEWEYIPAVDADSPLIGRIMAAVRTLREDAFKTQGYSGEINTTVSLPFTWPDEGAAVSLAPFEEDTDDIEAPSPRSEVDPLTCATGDFELTPYSTELSEERILIKTRIACWHSHFSAIRDAATAEVPHVSLFMEDDVDMEVDIQERLSSVWGYLPADWDIVFLGHCWGHETLHEPLGPPSPLASTHIHPSNVPLCMHAYALSPTGATRLLRHLAHPPFAYSRPIDNAIVWLIQSGRMKSFSVAPSIVVQRKIDASDVLKGVVYTDRFLWDHLENGVLANADEDNVLDSAW